MALAMTAFHVAILFIAAATFVAAAISDARAYRIPNSLCLLLLVLFPAFVFSAPRAVEWSHHLMVFGLVSGAGLALFAGNLIGAGDIKLLAAASLWAGPHLIAVLLVVTAFAGGVESIVLAGVAYIRQRRDSHKKYVLVHKNPIPYGVAIATGGLTMLGMMAQPILLPR